MEEYLNTNQQEHIAPNDLSYFSVNNQESKYSRQQI
jgi:hypothetical protein